MWQNSNKNSKIRIKSLSVITEDDKNKDAITIKLENSDGFEAF